MASARRECFDRLIVFSEAPAAADDPLLFVPRTVPHAPGTGQTHADYSSCHATCRAYLKSRWGKTSQIAVEAIRVPQAFFRTVLQDSWTSCSPGHCSCSEDGTAGTRT
jgi:hypothetical protein